LIAPLYIVAKLAGESLHLSAQQIVYPLDLLQWEVTRVDVIGPPVLHPFLLSRASQAPFIEVHPPAGQSR
jgi:hypothetical protein